MIILPSGTQPVVFLHNLGIFENAGALSFYGFFVYLLLIYNNIKMIFFQVDPCQ